MQSICAIKGDIYDIGPQQTIVQKIHTPGCMVGSIVIIDELLDLLKAWPMLLNPPDSTSLVKGWFSYGIFGVAS